MSKFHCSECHAPLDEPRLISRGVCSDECEVERDKSDDALEVWLRRKEDDGEGVMPDPMDYLLDHQGHGNVDPGTETNELRPIE